MIVYISSPQCDYKPTCETDLENHEKVAHVDNHEEQEEEAAAAAEEEQCTEAVAAAAVRTLRFVRLYYRDLALLIIVRISDNALFGCKLLLNARFRKQLRK